MFSLLTVSACFIASFILSHAWKIVLRYSIDARLHSMKMSGPCPDLIVVNSTHLFVVNDTQHDHSDSFFFKLLSVDVDLIVTYYFQCYHHW